MIPLQDIINEICIRRGDALGANASRLRMYALWVLRDLSMTHRLNCGMNYKWEVIHKENGMLKLPEDFAGWFKVGFIHNGNFIGLGHNELMSPLTTDDCGNYLENIGGDSTGSYIDPFSPLGRGGVPSFSGWGGMPVLNPMFKLGAGWSNDGYYRINRSTMTIDLSQYATVDSVLLFYYTSGMQSDGKNYVFPLIQNCIEAGIEYKEAEDNLRKDKTGADRAAENLARLKYGREVTKAKVAMHGSSYDDMIASYRQAGKASNGL